MKLFNEDCLDVLKRIEDNSVDLLVTDCPYKIVSSGVSLKYKACGGVLNKEIPDNTACSNKWIKQGVGIPSAVRNGKMFSHNDILFSDWLPEVYRVLKDGSHAYIMINSRNLKDLQVEAEKVGFKFMNLLVWQKGNFTPNKYYMQGAEFILLLRKGFAKNINNMGSKNILDVPNIIGDKKHPTEKPVELMKTFILNSSNENETVLDPFMGAGATGVASKELNRNFIGIEIDKQYFDIAEKRINKIQEEPTLF